MGNVRMWGYELPNKAITVRGYQDDGGPIHVAVNYKDGPVYAWTCENLEDAAGAVLGELLNKVEVPQPIEWAHTNELTGVVTKIDPLEHDTTVKIFKETLNTVNPRLGSFF